MLAAFKKHIEQHLPALFTSKVLLAVSGGVDSMVLLHLFKSLKLNFVVAHCNFQLRECESDLDEELVKKYCTDNNIIFYIKRFNTLEYAALSKVSIQMAARELRYNWFEELCNENQLNYIITAHHLDDQLETFLINFTRGTGIGGLVGIPEQNKNIVRPLLPFSREDILNYANRNHIFWREDASNASTKYLRNKIRHLIVPFFKEENNDFLNAFQKTIRHLQDTQFIAEKALDQFVANCVTEDENLIQIDLQVVGAHEKPFVYLTTYLKRFGFESSIEIEKICNAGTGKVLKNANFTLVNDRNKLLLFENSLQKEQKMLIKSISDLKNNPFIIQMTEVSEIDTVSDKNIIFVNSDFLKWPLVLRKHLEGDVFVPFGFKGSKKVSKFYKDVKLSQFEKNRQWILQNGDGKIIWIVGLRADDRFKVVSNTSKIYKITTNQ